MLTGGSQHDGPSSAGHGEGQCESLLAGVAAVMRGVWKGLVGQDRCPPSVLSVRGVCGPLVLNSFLTGGVEFLFAICQGGPIARSSLKVFIVQWWLVVGPEGPVVIRS